MITTRTIEPLDSRHEPQQALRWRGVGALLSGLIGLIIGIGVGVRWLGAGMVTWESLGAAGGLIAGIALTWLGVRWMTRGLRATARIFAVIILALATAVIVWTISPALVATNVPPTIHDSDLGLGGRQADLVTEDGVRLWSWYVPPPTGKTVVVRHGSGSNAASVLEQASVLVRNGYGVLVTDARGHGRSEGSAMDFGWFGEVDLQAAIDFLADQPEVDPGRIAVLGMSMGGEEAIGGSASDDRIAAVVAEGATARTDADKTWLVDEYGWRGWVQVRLEWIQYGFTDLLTSADKPRSLASAAALADPTPILMITGGAVPDEGKAAEHIRAASPENVVVWTVPGAGHIGGLSTAPDDWEQTVVAFLDDALEDG